MAALRVEQDEPGWLTFSIDGRYAYPSTGEIIETKSRKIVGKLVDEENRDVMSEKLMQIVFRDGRPVATGDQFGIGRANQSPANSAACTGSNVVSPRGSSKMQCESLSRWSGLTPSR